MPVARVVVEAAAQFRAAALRDRADAHGARAELGAEVRALDLDLLDHVVVHAGHQPAVARRLDEIRAIQADRVVRGADAVDRVAPRVVRAAEEAHALELILIGRHHAGQDAEQLEGTAANDRQVVDLVRGQHALACARLRSQRLRWRRPHRDDLALAGDLEADGHASRVVRAEDDPAMFGGREP